MNVAQFEAHARLEDHHWWFTARRRILLRLLGRVASPGAPIADIGCGTGGNAAAFAAAGYRVLGLDPSADAIALALARFPAIAFRCTADPAEAATHLAPGGTVVMTDVLEHVAADRELLAEAIAAVPVGGHLLLTVPADPEMWTEHDVAFGHHRRYTRRQFRALWEEAPVVERLCTPYNARLRPLIALYRRWSRLRGAHAGGGDLEVPVGILNGGLHAVFQSEARRLVAALDRPGAPFRSGVSLLAVLRRR